MPSPRARDAAPSARASVGAARVARSVLDDDAFFHLARAAAVAIGEGNAALTEHGLRSRSYSVLALAAVEPGPSQRELAATLGLDPSQVVALVDDLQSRGLVERRPDPSDRRANVVVATEAGGQLLADASVTARATVERVHAGMNDDERATLVRLLKRIAFAAD